MVKWAVMNHEHKPVTAFLALGSNLGDRAAILKGARQMLHVPPERCVTTASALYETEPVGGPEGQSPYLNAVLKIQTSLTAADLLAAGLEVEQHFGRRRQERWGARSLDIDLLFFGDRVFRKPELTVPHPRLHQRAFVLVPLDELAPDLIHPLSGLTVREMLLRLPSTAGVRRLSTPW